MRSATRWASAALALLFWCAPLAAAGRGADGEFEKRTSSHFVLYQDVDIDSAGGFRGSRRFEQQVLGVLEQAYDRLDDLLGLRPERRIEVVVYDPAAFDAHFRGRFRFPIAGVFNGVIHVRGDRVLTQQLGRVLHHELVHAAFRAAAPSLVLPAWVNEGVAEWFEARAQSKRHLSAGEQGYLVRAGRGGGLHPLRALSGVNFARLGRGGANLAYLQSYAMIEHLVRWRGESALRKFCAELVRTQDLRRALRRAARTDAAELDTRLRAELS